jgi:hypothetical protein
MTKPIKISSGAFADVWDLNNGKVLKAFRSKSRAHGQRADIKDDDLLTAVFCSMEINAYLSASEIKQVSPYIPTFYCQEDPNSILPNTNDNYVKGAGFIIEKIEGKDRKFIHLSTKEKIHVEIILQVLNQNLGALDVWDSSCFYTSEVDFKVIDFALWDASDYQCQLCECGAFNKQEEDYLRALVHN